MRILVARRAWRMKYIGNKIYAGPASTQKKSYFGTTPSLNNVLKLNTAIAAATAKKKNLHLGFLNLKRSDMKLKYSAGRMIAEMSKRCCHRSAFSAVSVEVTPYRPKDQPEKEIEVYNHDFPTWLSLSFRNTIRLKKILLRHSIRLEILNRFINV